MGLRQVTVCAVMLVLAGCRQDQQRSAGVSPPPEPPPQLWKVTVLQGTGDDAVQLCADGRLASGFTSITPEIGGQRCRQDGPVNGVPPNQSYKCQIDGQVFGVATTVSGRYPEDFTATSSVVDIDSQRSVYGRALHFSHVGLCPPGWAVGQAIDPDGKRINAAYVVGTNVVYRGRCAVTADPQNSADRPEATTKSAAPRLTANSSGRRGPLSCTSAP